MNGHASPSILERTLLTGRRRRTIIFDGDDTLWQIQPLYDRAKSKFADFMVEQGFDRCLALSKLDEIDVANIKKMGFVPERFPSSMVQTYAAFCADQGITPSSRAKHRARQIGTSVFSLPPIIDDKTYDLLRTLRSDYRLLLYTLGDYETQWAKVTQLGMDRFFDRTDIYIVAQKNSTQLRQILNENGLTPDDVWMVGNSLKSDINPALELGIKCIWIDGKSWKYDAEKQLPGTVHRIHNLSEVLAIVGES